MITIKYDGPGRTLIKEKFDKKNPGFQIIDEPKILTLREGESIVLFPNAGVSYEIKAYDFAP